MNQQLQEIRVLRGAEYFQAFPRILGRHRVLKCLRRSDTGTCRGIVAAELMDFLPH